MSFYLLLSGKLLIPWLNPYNMIFIDKEHLSGAILMFHLGQDNKGILRVGKQVRYPLVITYIYLSQQIGPIRCLDYNASKLFYKSILLISHYMILPSKVFVFTAKCRKFDNVKLP